jgi:hypothetical protein
VLAVDDEALLVADLPVLGHAKERPVLVRAVEHLDQGAVPKDGRGGRPGAQMVPSRPQLDVAPDDVLNAD